MIQTRTSLTVLWSLLKLLEGDGLVAEFDVCSVERAQYVVDGVQEDAPHTAAA